MYNIQWNARDDTVSTTALNELSVEAVHKIARATHRRQIDTMGIERELVWVQLRTTWKSRMILNERSI
jgi:hypothetical protein